MSGFDPGIAAIAAARGAGEIGFRDAVYAVVQRIPDGQVLGYGQVAALMGSPRAARQVGYALAALPPERADPLAADAVPWWRVIRTDGSIARQGDPARGDHQQALLEAEGVALSAERVPMERFQWRPG